MTAPAPAAPLLREVVRLYVRAQRAQAKCRDGASTVQCHVLTELLRQPGLTQQALAERLGLDKGWISRAVEALVADGAVWKRPSELDRRSVALGLTPAGRVRAELLEQELNGHAAQLLAGIPHRQHAQIQASLAMLLRALRQADERKGDGCGAGTSASATEPVLAFRPATARDWPAIERLLTAAQLPLDGALDQLDHFLTGWNDAELVCAGALEIHGDAALLRSVVVAGQARGRACGKRLVAQLAQRARQLGVSRLYLLTTTAQTFFASLGFVETGRADIPGPVRRSRQFRGACPDSAVAMTLPLDAAAAPSHAILTRRQP